MSFCVFLCFQDLFRVIIDSKWLSHASYILFLNKIDLFQAKIKTSHLADYFPEYAGPKADYDAAKEFILNLFVDIAVEMRRTIFSHYTQATGALYVVFFLYQPHPRQNDISANSTFRWLVGSKVLLI